MKGFFDFIRKRGVVGFAVGFILGGAVTKLVTSFVDDIVNPLLGIGLGFTKNLNTTYFQIWSAKIMWGSFIINIINFVVLAAVVYFLFKILGIERLDKLEEKKEENKKKIINNVLRGE